MKQFAVWAAAGIGALMLGGGVSGAQKAKPTKPLVTLGTVSIPEHVTLTGGGRLSPGTYEVRLLPGEPKPATPPMPGVQRQVEFVRRGKFRAGTVAGSEAVNVVPAADADKILDREGEPPGGEQQLKVTPHDFLRIWFNKGATHY